MIDQARDQAVVSYVHHALSLAQAGLISIMLRLSPNIRG